LIISLTPPGRFLLANIESVINQNCIDEKSNGRAAPPTATPITPGFLRISFKGFVRNITG
jgi:hypothetical protein